MAGFSVRPAAMEPVKVAPVAVKRFAEPSVPAIKEPMPKTPQIVHLHIHLPNLSDRKRPY